MAYFKRKCHFIFCSVIWTIGIMCTVVTVKSHVEKYLKYQSMFMTFHAPPTGCTYFFYFMAFLKYFYFRYWFSPYHNLFKFATFVSETSPTLSECYKSNTNENVHEKAHRAIQNLDSRSWLLLRYDSKYIFRDVTKSGFWISLRVRHGWAMKKSTLRISTCRDSELIYELFSLIHHQTTSHFTAKSNSLTVGIIGKRFEKFNFIYLYTTFRLFYR